jgi:hypothetical protein
MDSLTYLPGLDPEEELVKSFAPSVVLVLAALISESYGGDIRTSLSRTPSPTFYVNARRPVTGVPTQITSPRPLGPTMNVDVWSYVRGGFRGRMTIPNSNGLGQTPTQVSQDTVVYTRTDGLLITYVRNKVPGRIVVESDAQVKTTAQTPSMRCFGDNGTSCAATYGPSSMPLSIDLPVLPATAVSNMRVTDAGEPMFSGKHFYVNSIDPMSCRIQSSDGPTPNSAKAFVVDSYDFGGDIGVQNDVLVLEGVGGVPAGSENQFHGQRLERYWFVKGYGYVREEGWDDPSCRANPTPSNCNGNYTKSAPGASTWNQLSSAPIAPLDLCAALTR